MTPRSGSEIREMFLKFFESKEHRRVHSSSLVPANDPTLLFTNAGMNQFKDVFLGAEHRDYSRATTSQKCVRAGGKHNDLENVGFTRRHHTFFEMLGNFSFGDYFKRDAIAFAWELITSQDWFGIPEDRLFVTIFEGDAQVPRDDEAQDLWIDVGVPRERIFGYGRKDNFWQMGETGPCGPCSEIFYDMGLEAAETPGVDKPFGQDDARYVEIWNLVFMQFDRSATGDLTPLPKPSIDTGMGLERVAAVLQGVVSNYQTDLFRPLITSAATLVGLPTGARTPVAPGAPYDPLPVGVTEDKKRSSEEYHWKKNFDNPSLRIIADHARAATFLISDNVTPSNEGRGYVLRKILRRAIFHGRKQDQLEPFLYKMVGPVCDLFARSSQDEPNPPYPELLDSADRVSRVIEAEERQFGRVLLSGATMLQALLNQTEADEEGKKNFAGDKAFHLYETYGLPLDFIIDAVQDSFMTFDHEGFDRAKEAEQARARASWKGGSQKSASPVFRDLPKTDFEGYGALTIPGAEVLAIVKDGAGVQQANPGDNVEIVLNETTFYADSGGQVGDVGWLYSDDHNTVVADVSGCTKPVQGVFAHRALVRQPIRVGDHVDTVVDTNFRDATRRNHTGTHLLHAALREVLGTHVKQAGSLVDPTRLRFDFSHFTSVADEELQDIEEIVNKQVLANTPVITLEDVPIDVAVNEYHAMALFGEKYGERVRVVKIGDFSTELCGGTHTGATGEIGVVKLLNEGSVSSGVRRVEAVTGLGALNEFRRDFQAAQLASQLAPDLAPADALRQRLASNEEEVKRLRRELDEARMKSAASSLSAATDQVIEVKGVKVLAQRVGALDRGQMRTLVDNLRNKLGSGVVILGSADGDGKVALIVGVTKDLTGKLAAGKVIGPIAKLVGGSGGGRPDMAEAGGKDAAQLDAALVAAPEIVSNLLS
jgi:alanyl-tRNA synthetase